MTGILDSIKLDVPTTTHLVPEIAPVAPHLERIPAMFRHESIYHDEEYIELSKKTKLSGADFELLIRLLHRHGGFSDLLIAAGSYIFRKKNKILMPVFARLMSKDEVDQIVEHMYGSERRSEAYAPGEQIDEIFQVFEKDAELPYRNRVNVCSFAQKNTRALKIAMRDLPAIPPSFDDLNVKQVIREHSTPRQGLVIIAGQTGSGKTTLCAAIIRAIKESTTNYSVTLCYESPTEFDFDNIKGYNPVWQHTVGKYGDFTTFDQGLQNALRCVPNNIFLGESREKDTFIVLPKVGESGHMGLTTLHAKSIANIFTRIGNEIEPSQMYGVIRQILQYMHLAVYQWLAPTINGGQVPIQEVLVFTTDIKKKILDQPDDKLIEAIGDAVEEHGLSFKKEAQSLLDQGLISQDTYTKAVLSQ